MITELKPYPTMKDSGVEWLGEVPEHWELVPNRAVMRLKKDIVGTRSGEYVLLSLTKQGIIARDMENPEGKFPASFDTYQAVEPGDLIFCLFDIDETPRAVGLSSLNGMITGAYTRFFCSDPSVREFVYLLYLSLDNGKLLKPLYSGLRKVIQKSTFLSAKFALPPLPEQAAIVRYLDHVDRRVQRVKQSKQKLITLLTEQKQVIIHKAVTRGLDPNVPLKDSGVEWLGLVPEHWGVRRLKFLIKGRLTYGANAAAEHKNPDWPRYLRITDFRLDGSLRSASFRSLPPEIAKEYLVQPGDLLLARSGATVGKAFLVRSEAGQACHAGYLIRARPRRAQLNPNYFFLFTQSTGFKRWKDSTFIITTIQNINAEKYADLAVPTPPIDEQAQITAHLDQATADIDNAIARANREVDLMNEYHTRLIADVVTGKIDVREAATNLHNEPDYPNNFNEISKERMT